MEEKISLLIMTIWHFEYLLLFHDSARIHYAFHLENLSWSVDSHVDWVLPHQLIWLRSLGFRDGSYSCQTWQTITLHEVRMSQVSYLKHLAFTVLNFLISHPVTEFSLSIEIWKYLVWESLSEKLRQHSWITTLASSWFLFSISFAWLDRRCLVMVMNVCTLLWIFQMMC